MGVARGAHLGTSGLFRRNYHVGSGDDAVQVIHALGLRLGIIICLGSGFTSLTSLSEITTICSSVSKKLLSVSIPACVFVRPFLQERGD